MRRQVAPGTPCARALAWAAWVALFALTCACRRDAVTPIASAQLFPDAGAAPTAGAAEAPTALARAENVAEVEPNDSAAEAQPIAANAIVEGALVKGAGAKPAAAKGRAKGSVVIDEDWYRLPAVQPGQLAQIDLRSAPPCAELELYDDTGHTLVRRAKPWKAVRPVLPSIGAEAHASLVRVVCRAKAGAEAEALAGGAYRLAVWSRAVLPSEEVEPNDKVAAATQVIALGSTLQATLAPLEDTDAFVLDLKTAGAGECLQVSVAAVPDVEMEVALYDPVTLQAVLKRQPGRGQGALIPNLDVRRVGDHPIVSIRAVSGNQPDAAYVVGVQTYLPAGCLHQIDCPNLMPTEREPNDEPAHAMPVVPGVAVTGFLDAPGDIDWLGIQGKPGQVAVLRLSGPAAWKVALTVQGGAELSAAAAGQPLLAGGLVLGAAGLVVGVHGQKDASSLTEPWRLDIALYDFNDYETSTSQPGVQADPWSPAHALVRRPLSADFAQGGWSRHGMLGAPREVDAYGLDLRARTAPIGLSIDCGGDGALGLTCTVLAEDGRELLVVPADLNGATPGHRSALLVPGRYRIVVQAPAGRASAQPYAIVLREQADVQGLPLGATPVDDPAQTR